MQKAKGVNMNKYLDERSNLTNREIIELIRHFLKEKSYKLDQPQKIQQFGKFGLVNPGTKNFPNVLDKLYREISTEEDKNNNVKLDEIIERDYANCDSLIIDNLRDICRFSIIIPDYTSAPAVISAFLGEFGGTLEIHNKPSYKAIHMNTAYNKFKTEFQFHTKEFLELKNATDPFYHKHINDKKDKSDKDSIKKELDKYCQVFYSRSDFEESLPKIEYIYNTYLSQNPIQPKAVEPKNFVEFWTKAYINQNVLYKHLTNFLTNLTTSKIKPNPNMLNKNNTDELKQSK